MVDLGLESDRAVSATLSGRTSPIRSADRTVDQIPYRLTPDHMISDTIVYREICHIVLYQTGFAEFEDGYVRLAVVPMVYLSRGLESETEPLASPRQNGYTRACLQHRCHWRLFPPIVLITLLGQHHSVSPLFLDKSLRFQVVCPQNGTAVL